MERRETYDPEDIESLLSERAFDELLDEERAFVLRHLSGREEYEAMRALLLQVRQDERPEAGLELDEAVKEQVLAAYRAQRRPQWGFSLNSVLAAFWPRNATDLWRPALALAAMVAVVLLSVTLWQRLSPHETQFAELREVEKQDSLPVPAAVEDMAKVPSGAEEQMELAAVAKGATASSPEMLAEVNDAPLEVHEEPARPTALAKAEADHSVKTDSTYLADVASTEDVQVERSLMFSESEVTRTVQTKELVSNMSVTNISAVEARKASASKKRSADVDRSAKAQSLAETPQLMGLLAAAW
ncbi:MAG: hypothetical protein JNM31_01065 [Flavobacteriales bacterium]|nr:hypothetical protein [Flavobacteriales bacterium]